MNHFENLPFQVATTDGRNFTLLADAFYVAKDGTRYCLPAGATSDGASTPAEVWPLIPPFGLYWPAAFLHDAAYRNTLFVCNSDNNTDITTTRVKAALPKEKCDALLLEAMETLGVGMVERHTIYEGVVLGGKSSFETDRTTTGTSK